MEHLLSALTDITIDGVALWVVILIALGVFLAGFMDAIAGGGGIISVPTYLIGLSGLPVYYALSTNKLSACLGAVFSAGRFIRGGYVNWRLFSPAVVLALVGSAGGAFLQLHTPDFILKSLLLVVLPVVAVVTLRTRTWPDEPGQIDPRRQKLIIWGASFIIGAYDGYYGPGTGTFLMLVYIQLGRMDTLHAAGGAKLINMASGLGSLATGLATGHVLVGVGIVAAVASIMGSYLGAGLAIQGGSKVVRPTVVLVLVLLTAKVGSELLFPGLWG